MSEKYLIVDDFQARNKRVLALDRDRTFDIYNAFVVIDGQSYSFGVTHNRRWITFDMPWLDGDFVGKTVYFI